jgi:hypothetical protein
MTVAKGAGEVETDARCEMTRSYQAEGQHEYWHIDEQRSDPETCLTLERAILVDLMKGTTGKCDLKNEVV